jgi:hypothetical protein
MMVMVMGHSVMVMMHRMVVHRVSMAVVHPRRSHAGRERKGEGRRERQGDDFQGLSPKIWCVPRIRIRTQANPIVQINAERLPRLGAEESKPRDKAGPRR